MIPQVQIPDFVGTLQRQQALAQQGEMSRLQMLALRQAQEDADIYRGAAASIIPQLGAATGDTRSSLLAKLAAAGPQGAQIALPMLTQDRERAQRQATIAGIFGDGGAPAATGAAPAASGAPGDAGTPRGIRNNNPLNIIDAPFTRGQPGFAGSDGRFARFNSPEEGLAAADTLLQSYAQRGLNTPIAIISRWAPAGDGNNNPQAYTATVARRLGVAPDAPLDMNNPQVRRQLAMAMAEVENGRPYQVASAGGPVMSDAGPPGPAPGSPAAPAPQQRPGSPAITEAQVMRLAASGDPQLMQMAQVLAPFVRRDTDPQLSEIADPTSPTGRRLVPRAQAAGQPAPGPQGPQGPQPSWYQQRVLELGPLVANGTATPAQQQEYAVAATLWQTGGQQMSTIPVDPNNPNAGTQQVAIPRPLPPNYPAPPALGGQPQAPAQGAPAAAAPAAAAQPGGVPIGATGMTAAPPDPNAPRVVSTTAAGAPTSGDRTKLRQIETEAAGIQSALSSFREARRNASISERALAAAGRPTALATAWTNAALLAKGEALFNLGVLNGPDLSIIQRALSNPSTISGFFVGQETAEAQIKAIETLLEQRLATARQQYGGQTQDQSRGNTPPPAPTMRWNPQTQRVETVSGGR